ncbi:hypothetical protein GCM10010353_41920 [Streptomyces chryseus]|uniref:Transposase n=1 Tax=Streptomyces chryseus TaxID=68186 RepID=A0ABQ3DK12_9ACTN|nr:hypothetical protein GCM10010353_41920 [Streptomyces chryseus]GHB03144.1 hypothetical protein GCM10010346_27450 [Streptomyces chryseus]
MKGFRPGNEVDNAKDPTRRTGRGLQPTTRVRHPREGALWLGRPNRRYAGSDVSPP